MSSPAQMANVFHKRGSVIITAIVEMDQMNSNVVSFDFSYPYNYISFWGSLTVFLLVSFSICFVTYRRVPKVTASVTFGISRPEEPQPLGSYYVC